MHFASVKPSAERLYTFLNMEEERSGSKRVEKEISPILEFKNVRFQYGENIKVLKLSEYRSLFSVVSQKSALFLGDIVQNIDLEGKADRQKLNEVLRKSGVKKYLQRFPEKEKTQIGDDGAFLSGGERQKLVVARALLKDAPVMLFDEASSGFDVEANEYLYKIITEEMPEKSVIFITHHYDKLEKCRGD